MKKLTPIFAVCLFAITAFAQLNVRQMDFINDVQQNSQQSKVMEWYRGESLTYNIFLFRDNAEVQIPSDVTPIWKIWKTNDLATLYMNYTGTVSSTGGNSVQFQVPAGYANLPTGTYVSAAQLWQGTNYMGVAGYGTAKIIWSPAGDSIAYVGTVRDNNFVPRPTNTWTAGYALASTDGGTTTYAVSFGTGSATGGQWNGSVAGASNLALAAYALATQAQATASSPTDSTARAWILSISNKAVTAFDSATDAVARANALGAYSLASNAAAGAFTTDLTARAWATGASNLAVSVAAYTNRAAGALQSNVWALAASTTDYTSRVTFNAASNDLRNSIGSVSTSVTTEAASRLAGDNSIGLVATNLVASSQAADASLTSGVRSVGLGLTNEIAARLAADNAIGLGLTNETAARIAADASITGNVQSVGLGLTNLTAQMLSADASLTSGVKSVGLGLTGEITRATGAEAALSNRVAALDGGSNDLRNATGLLTTGLLSVGVSATNAQTLAAITSGIVSNLNTNSVLLSVTNSQTILRPVAMLDSLKVGTNVTIAANVNYGGAQLLVNGSFTGNADSWTLNGGATYNANQILALDGFTGSIVPSNAPSMAGVLLAEYTVNGVATATITVAVGGYTNVYSYAGSSSVNKTNSFDFAPVNASNMVISWSAPSGAFGLDNVGLRRYKNGSLWVADQVRAGTIFATGLVVNGVSITDINGETGVDVTNALNAAILANDAVDSNAFVKKTGDLMTGGLTFTGNIQIIGHSETKYYALAPSGSGVASPLLILSSNYPSEATMLSVPGTNAGFGRRTIPSQTTHLMWDAGNDGTGSGMDADLLDGLDSLQFLRTNGLIVGGGNNGLQITNANGFVYLATTSSVSGGSGGDTSTWAQVLLQGGPYDSSSLTNLNLTKGTGAVAAAWLVNVQHTSQVDRLNGTATNITILGAINLGIGGTNILADAGGTNLVYNGVSLRDGNSGGGGGGSTNPVAMAYNGRSNFWNLTSTTLSPITNMIEVSDSHNILNPTNGQFSLTRGLWTFDATAYIGVGTSHGIRLTDSAGLFIPYADTNFFDADAQANGQSEYASQTSGGGFLAAQGHASLIVTSATQVAVVKWLAGSGSGNIDRSKIICTKIGELP